MWGAEGCRRRTPAESETTAAARRLRSRMNAMNLLGNGLAAADHDEEALSVQEAELLTLRRMDVPEEQMLVVQGNLASTYQALGRFRQALRMRRETYSKRLGFYGADDCDTLRDANNYALSLNGLQCFEEAKSLMREMLPVARLVAGDNDEVTLRMKWNYAEALYKADGATLDDIREAVTTLEETDRTARRVLGGAHPDFGNIEDDLRNARAALAARDVESLRKAVEAMAAGDA